MLMTIHCPGCQSPFDVPDQIGGHIARCPRCRKTFTIPEADSVIDEMVVSWMGLDHLYDDEEEDYEVYEVVSPEVTEGAVAMEPDVVAQPETRPEPEAKAPEPEPAPQPEPKIPVETPPARMHEERAAPKADAPGQAEQKTDEHGSFMAVALAEEASRKKERKAASEAHEYQSTRRDRNIYLEVREVRSYGVRMMFDSRLMELRGFRASMPMKCVHCGKGMEETDLNARPLVFADQARGEKMRSDEMEVRYEWPVESHQTAREVVAAMRTMEELEAPFNVPMPYYLCTGCRGAEVSVPCKAVANTQGVMCEVFIQSGKYALDWLGRVNGVCGDEYSHLEAEVLKLEEGGWRAVPEVVRKRLAAWFDFEGNEQFMAYFNDGDFARADAGLAGVVMTDHRLVFCKYHHHGIVPLTAQGMLVAEGGGRFAELRYERDGHGRHLMKLRWDDVPRLRQLLVQADQSLRLIERRA